MRYVTLTTIFLLIDSWSFSQTGYPKKLVLDNGDTVIAITTQQMNISSLVYLQYREYKELNDSLLPYMDSCTALVSILNRMNGNLNQQLVVTDSVVAGKNYIITEATKTIKRQDRSIRKLHTANRVLYGIVAGLSLAVLLLL
jgi:hypothetical protein